MPGALLSRGPATLRVIPAGSDASQAPDDVRVDAVGEQVAAAEPDRLVAGERRAAARLGAGQDHQQGRVAVADVEGRAVVDVRPRRLAQLGIVRQQPRRLGQVLGRARRAGTSRRTACPDGSPSRAPPGRRRTGHPRRSCRPGPEVHPRQSTLTCPRDLLTRRAPGPRRTEPLLPPSGDQADPGHRHPGRGLRRDGGPVREADRPEERPARCARSPGFRQRFAVRAVAPAGPGRRRRVRYVAARRTRAADERPAPDRGRVPVGAPGAGPGDGPGGGRRARRPARAPTWTPR